MSFENNMLLLNLCQSNSMFVFLVGVITISLIFNILFIIYIDKIHKVKTRQKIILAKGSAVHNVMEKIQDIIIEWEFSRFGDKVALKKISKEFDKLS